MDPISDRTPSTRPPLELLADCDAELERLRQFWDGASISKFSQDSDSGGSGRGEIGEIPSKIAHYEIQRILGAGGFGTVFLALDTEKNRRVALKILHRASYEAREGFLREAYLLSQLRHEHLVQCYDFGHYENRPYYVMEYVEGTSLAQVIRAVWLERSEKKKEGQSAFDFLITANPKTLERERYGSFVLRVGFQVAQTLEFLHAQGLVHQDLKPGNILIDHKGRAKLSDFGLAIRFGGEEREKSGGTFPYMSPEQVRRQMPDPQSDIFSFGACFYEAFGLERAFPGTESALVTRAILEREPAPLRQLDPGIPEQIEAIVSKCLQKSPELRYQRAQDLVKDLSSHIQGDAPVNSAQPRRSLALGLSTGLWVSGALMLMAAVGLWYFGMTNSGSKPELAVREAPLPPLPPISREPAPAIPTLITPEPEQPVEERRSPWPSESNEATPVTTLPPPLAPPSKVELPPETHETLKPEFHFSFTGHLIVCPAGIVLLSDAGAKKLSALDLKGAEKELREMPRDPVPHKPFKEVCGWWVSKTHEPVVLSGVEAMKLIAYRQFWSVLGTVADVNVLPAGSDFQAGYWICTKTEFLPLSKFLEGRKENESGLKLPIPGGKCLWVITGYVFSSKAGPVYFEGFESRPPQTGFWDEMIERMRKPDMLRNQKEWIATRDLSRTPAYRLSPRWNGSAWVVEKTMLSNAEKVRAQEEVNGTFSLGPYVRVSSDSANGKAALPTQDWILFNAELIPLGEFLATQ